MDEVRQQRHRRDGGDIAEVILDRPDSLNALTLEMATQIAANSPVAVRAAKRALRDGAGLSLADALDVEDAAWRTAAGSADRREGIAAFAERRRPSWPSAREGSA